jgi:uncharacterized membrane protein (UPF0127 family)
MPAPGPTGYAFNRTRQVYLATKLSVARTHWTRFRGLMGENSVSFGAGRGLWIVPSRGVHTFAMKFPIDVIYLDEGRTVLHLEKHLSPWRMAPVRVSAKSVLELPNDTLSLTGTALGDEIEIVEGQSGEDDPA